MRMVEKVKVKNMLDYESVHKRTEKVMEVWYKDGNESLLICKRELEKLEQLVNCASECYLISGGDYPKCLDEINGCLYKVVERLYGQRYRRTARIEVNL